MTIHRIYLFILIFAPLAFGAVEQWSLAIMGCLCLFTLLWYVISLHRQKEMLYEVPGILPLLLLLLYMLFQIVPLPAGFVKFISPSTYDLYKETIGVFDPVDWMSISINKRETLNEFFRFSAYAAIYILTVQLLKDKVILKKTIAIIITFASALSVLAILQYFIQSNETWSSHKLFFFRELTHGGTPFGPYACRNHYAGLMEMIFPLCLALFLSYKPSISYQSLREKIVEIFNHDRTNIYILLGFSSILIATSIFLSLSRGAIVSLLCALLLFSSIAYKRVMSGKSNMQIFLFFILTLLFIGWFGWGQIFDRFMQIRGASGEIESGRFLYWNDSIHIIKDFFLTGTGLGTFEDIYPTYRTFPGDTIVDHAHNDYIEIFSDGGIIAIMLMAWFLGTVILTSYTMFIKRRETYSIYLYIGSLTGIVSILIHSITDFNLQIGAKRSVFLFSLRDGGVRGEHPATVKEQTYIP